MITASMISTGPPWHITFSHRITAWPWLIFWLCLRHGSDQAFGTMYTDMKAVQTKLGCMFQHPTNIPTVKTPSRNQIMDKISALNGLEKVQSLFWMQVKFWPKESRQPSKYWTSLVKGSMAWYECFCPWVITTKVSMGSLKQSHENVFTLGSETHYNHSHHGTKGLNMVQ